MSIEDFVTISISADSVGVQEAGFGVPLILSTNADWVERVRFYESLSDVAADFETTDYEYLMASAIFASAVNVEQIAIGRCALPPTQKYTITPAVVTDEIDYTVTINGTDYTFTSGVGTTNDLIVAGLLALINAGSGDTLTATGTATLILTANTAGAFDSVEVADTSLLSIVQDHVDPGLATDLAAIALEDSSWYFILHAFNSKACALIIAAYAEANDKLFVCQTGDSNNVTLASGGDTNTSTMAAIQNAEYVRTAVIYHPTTDAFADCAWVGRCAPLDPGSETWAFKTLAGVDAVTMTSTHETNVEAKDGNHYQETAGVNIAFPGTVGSGEYIDVVRFRDWLKARMAERIFAHLAAANKIPYTDEGIAVIEADVRAQLVEGIAAGGLASDPAPVVTVPRASAVSEADRTARILRNVKFTATLAGAIHGVRITGVVSV
jgi:hypothetical protein